VWRLTALEQFGYFLRAWRKAHGLRLIDLEKISGISFERISNIENLKKRAGAKTQQKLQDAIATYELGVKNQQHAKLIQKV
jgi:transcriptional regulator with XRE-family HTH domain